MVLGSAGKVCQAAVWFGLVWFCKLRHGRNGKERLGKEWRVPLRCVAVRRGTAGMDIPKLLTVNKGAKTMVYEWKEAAQIKADAQKAGEMLENLEKTVGITPKNLVEANRDESAPLHNEFEWNDTKAAEKYRETQAGYIIRNICVVRESEEKPPVRAFYSVTTDEERKYESLNVIIKNEDKTKKLLESALRELIAFKAKYSMLSEIANVIKAIDEVQCNIEI